MTPSNKRTSFKYQVTGDIIPHRQYPVEYISISWTKSGIYTNYRKTITMSYDTDIGMFFKRFANGMPIKNVTVKFTTLDEVYFGKNGCKTDDGFDEYEVLMRDFAILSLDEIRQDGEVIYDGEKLDKCCVI